MLALGQHSDCHPPGRRHVVECHSGRGHFLLLLLLLHLAPFRLVPAVLEPDFHLQYQRYNVSALISKIPTART